MRPEARRAGRRSAASSSPIDTNVPGIRICEHLPRTATWMHRAALVRSVNHKAGCHNCLPSYTGFEAPMPDQHPRDTDPPSMGSVCEYPAAGRPRRTARLRLHALLARLGPGVPPRRALRRLPRPAITTPLTTECNPFADPGEKPVSRQAEHRSRHAAACRIPPSTPTSRSTD